MIQTIIEAIEVIVSPMNTTTAVVDMEIKEDMVDMTVETGATRVIRVMVE